MHCTVADRDRVREAAAEIRACDDVLGVDVLPPRVGPERGWSIEVTLTTAPAAPVLERLAAHDLATPDVSPRGSGFRLVATA